MDPILDLAKKYNLVVIEDACQAHGAEYFSKRDGCLEEGWLNGPCCSVQLLSRKKSGSVWRGRSRPQPTTKHLAKRMKMIRDHGQAKKYYHDIEGYNGRLDSIQAGWLSVKLRHLAKWNESRRKLAHRYHELLAEAKDSVVIPQEAFWTKGVYHLYVIRVQDREALPGTSRRSRCGNRYPLSDSSALANCLQTLGFQEGRFPSHRACSQRDCFTSHVPATPK